MPRPIFQAKPADWSKGCQSRYLYQMAFKRAEIGSSPTSTQQVSWRAGYLLTNDMSAAGSIVPQPAVKVHTYIERVVAGGARKRVAIISRHFEVSACWSVRSE